MVILVGDVVADDRSMWILVVLLSLLLCIYLFDRLIGYLVVSGLNHLVKLGLGLGQIRGVRRRIDHEWVCDVYK